MKTPGRGAAWAVLIGTGATSVTFNVVHATQGGRLQLILALLAGIMPAFVAACLSHVAAVYEAPWQAKAAVVAITAGVMVLSASSTAAVVAPADPGWRGWLFGLTLDAAALWALWAIMSSRGKAAATEDLAEELAAVRAELAAERAKIPARKPRPASARKPARVSARASDDLDAEAEALKLWMADPSIPGSKLGPMVDRTDSWGRAAVRKFKQTAPERMERP